MKQTTHWNRRTFLSAAGLTAAAAVSPRILIADSNIQPSTANPASYACLASGNEIQLFHVRDANWLPLTEPTSCEAPRSLALHPTRDILYIAHDTPQYLNLPRASISAWSIDPRAGTLLPISRTPLTLSATSPQHISISPDGNALLVSATGGGAYNIFSLASDGTILPGPHALKQTGRGPHPLQTSAQPHASVFHPTRPVAYACDFGADRINQFDLRPETPTIIDRTSLPPGSGPQHIALHPSGNMLIAASRLQPTLHVIAIDEKSHHLGASLQHLSLDATTVGPLCFDPSGDTLYATASTANRESILFAFQIDQGSRRIHQFARSRFRDIGIPQQLIFHQRRIYLAATNGVARLDNDTLISQHVLPRRAVTSIVMRAL
jgi:6-phosphogluconolactonase